MSTTNPTPNQVYVANSVPSGGLFADIYRPSNTAGTIAWSKLGTYRVNALSPQRAGIVKDRQDVDDGDNGWTLVAGPITGSITVQLATDATPTLQEGDAFQSSAFLRSLAGAAVPALIVITEIGINVDANARMMTGSVRFNKQATAGAASGYDNLSNVPEYTAI